MRPCEVEHMHNSILNVESTGIVCGNATVHTKWSALYFQVHAEQIGNEVDDGTFVKCE